MLSGWLRLAGQVSWLGPPSTRRGEAARRGREPERGRPGRWWPWVAWPGAASRPRARWLCVAQNLAGYEGWVRHC
jgi:hypothetical protein